MSRVVHTSRIEHAIVLTNLKAGGGNIVVRICYTLCCQKFNMKEEFFGTR